MTFLGQFYLPPAQDVRMEFLKLLLSGKKKMFQNKEVNRIVIPNWSEFRFEALYK